MNILFVHNNFPAQYAHVARALARRTDVKIAAIGSTTARAVKGVDLKKYALSGVDVSATHPFARRFDLECHRAEQVLYALSSLGAAGFVPDLIMAHPGWGETLPLRTVFPDVRLIVYCEFFYGTEGRDVGFDPEFPEAGTDGHVALHLKNAASLLALSDCDAGVAPTAWQRSTFPPGFQDKIKVLHEGIDTAMAKPAADAVFRLSSGRELKAGDEIITFVARNLEPLRGYHVFMRALPRVMAARPNAEILIVGGDGTSYGAPAPPGTTWKQTYLDEVADGIDLARVHFTGYLSYRDYLRVLQISAAHVYFSYPFVLSWSLLEAMSAGCLMIVSDTAPVREIVDDDNGVLVPFFDTAQLSERLIEALAHPARFKSKRSRARETVLERYDLERVCLPEMMDFIFGAGAGAGEAGRMAAPAARPIRRIRPRINKARVLARSGQ